MRGSELLDKMELTDLKYVEAADKTPKKKRKSRAKWAAAAACFGSMIIIGSLLYKNSVNIKPLFPTEGFESEYSTVGEADVILPWEYRTLPEKYSSVIFNGQKYNLSDRPVDASLIGNSLGTCNASGYDSFTEETHQISVEVFEIDGVSKEYIVAVRLGDEYYPAEAYNSAPPDNLGEMLDAYSLEKYVSFNRFTLTDNGIDKGEFILRDDAYIWEILNSCRDAEYINEDADGKRKYFDGKQIDFYLTSDALGLYNMSFGVTADGYIRTNAFGCEYSFKIGKDAAKKIISYATKNSTETEAEAEP